MIDPITNYILEEENPIFKEVQRKVRAMYNHIDKKIIHPIHQGTCLKFKNDKEIGKCQKAAIKKEHQLKAQVAKTKCPPLCKGDKQSLQWCQSEYKAELEDLTHY